VGRKSTGEPSPELAAAIAEFKAADAEFQRVWSGVVGWQFHIPGRGRVTANLGTDLIFKVYVLFLALTFVAGVVLAATHVGTELGVALVVGSIFAGGAFLAQMWVVQYERETKADEIFGGPTRPDYMRELARKHAIAATRVEQLSPGYFDR
jgi:hypothetical protein